MPEDLVHLLLALRRIWEDGVSNNSSPPPFHLTKNKNNWIPKGFP
jgi:hypothetical protein